MCALARTAALEGELEAARMEINHMRKLLDEKDAKLSSLRDEKEALHRQASKEISDRSTHANDLSSALRLREDEIRECTVRLGEATARLEFFREQMV